MQELELDVGEPVPVVVVANKKDLVSQRQVSEQEGRAVCKLLCSWLSVCKLPCICLSVYYFSILVVGSIASICQ